MDNETIKYDCFRGCVVTHDEQSGETNCSYRLGCCKLETYNWLKHADDGTFPDLFEVRFKNTRKGIYRNDSPQSIHVGDMVIVEAATGQDLGIVTLEGPIVGRQMKSRGINPETAEFRKIYRKARQADIEKWQQAIAREQETMIKARRIAAEMGLDMKIGDVEFQGDGTKAIFYYIADGRVDFRQLIKVFAEEFRIRIEMKQIGARQEAGRIGGIGPCGRELCCAKWQTKFQSVGTAAARFQDLSLNPQKLAGQCAKLKCCLNYEVDCYMEANKDMPSKDIVLYTIDGEYHLFKTDILAKLCTYSTGREGGFNTVTITAQRAFDVYHMNKRGEKPEKLALDEGEVDVAPEFTDGVGDEEINRFDRRKKNKSRNKKNNHDRKPKEPHDNQEGGAPHEHHDRGNHGHHGSNPNKPKRVQQE